MFCDNNKSDEEDYFLCSENSRRVRHNRFVEVYKIYCKYYIHISILLRYIKLYQVIFLHKIICPSVRPSYMRVSSLSVCGSPKHLFWRVNDPAFCTWSECSRGYPGRVWSGPVDRQRAHLHLVLAAIPETLTWKSNMKLCNSNKVKKKDRSKQRGGRAPGGNMYVYMLCSQKKN